MGQRQQRALPRREGEALPLHRNPGVPMKASHFALPLALLIAMPSLAATRGFEVRDMVNLDRYSSPTLSPDGRRPVFAKRVLDGESGKARTSLRIEALFARGAAPPKRRTTQGRHVHSPAGPPD